MLVAATLWFASAAAAVTRTYTTDADFDLGQLIGLEHESLADQLQLSAENQIMPYIWVPNDWEGTVSKVHTETGAEMGRYRVSPHSGSRPSRTTVDQRGDCYVGLRQAGTVVKIGLYEAGDWIDRNGDGICQTSYDMNGDGDITGDEVLPWGADECVLYELVLVPGYEGAYVPGSYTGPYDYDYWGVAPRGLGIDEENNIWVGTSSTSKFYYVHGETGAILKVVDVSAWDHHSYGATVDANGVVWSACRPGGPHVLRLDPRTNPPTIAAVEVPAVYGVTVDYLGHVFANSACWLTRIDAETGVVEWSVTKAVASCSAGVVCTADNDVWTADTDASTVSRYDNDGNLKATITGVTGPRGVAVDTAGKVWAGDVWDDFMHRIDPATNLVDLSKEIIGSGGHYTYSDMTGIISWTVTSKTGMWTVIYDSGGAGTNWGTLSWTADEPEGSTVTVEARSSGDRVNWSAWERAAIGVPLTATPDGRYLQIRATLARRFGDQLPVLYDLTVSSGAVPTRAVSHTTFESESSPWSALVAGPGEKGMWRRALAGNPAAHSGMYAMSAEVSGEGVSALMMEMPNEPAGSSDLTVRAWTYVDERTVGDAATFLGFSFAQNPGESLASMGPLVGWAVDSGFSSQLLLYDTQEPTGVGLTEGGWHLVQVRFSRATGRFGLWLDGAQLKDVAIPAAVGQSPTYAVLCAAGESSGALQQTYFDDVTVTLMGHPTPTHNHGFALVDGPEQVVEGETHGYTIHYGNGYPVLQPGAIGSSGPGSMYVAVSLPAGYQVVDATPAPTRNAGGTPVWELPIPDLDQAGCIYLQAMSPTGLAQPAADALWAWATDSPEAGTVDPPSPPGVSLPPDAVWGEPQDLLCQYVDLGSRPDLWVRKEGPQFASPGDTVNYQITVGNSGTGASGNLVIRDLLPKLLGGSDRVVDTAPPLDPGETWTGYISGALPWGVPGGTLVLNKAYVPTSPGEAEFSNNESTWTTTVQSASDPNRMVVTPMGGVQPGDELTYTMHCENVGAGTAYGVYATCELAKALDAGTLRVSDAGALRYDRTSRTLVWEVGKLLAGRGATVWFTVSVAADARRARPIAEQALVHFPSVPETTATNIVLNVVNSSFPDVPWSHWAILWIERTHEADIVQGYPDGTYRPALVVDRAQMAVYVARGMAGGDAHVPEGPGTPAFSDVGPEHWAYRYIEYAVGEGAVIGYPDGSYRPAEQVNRGQMAVYIARVLVRPAGDAGIPEPPDSPTFSDVTSTNDWAWCYPHVEYVAGQGVVAGFPNGTYRPEMNVTRDQMAVYVTRAFRLPN
jgi:uncharacterized repeat protein (TIGR01451 family)